MFTFEYIPGTYKLLLHFRETVLNVMSGYIMICYVIFQETAGAMFIIEGRAANIIQPAS